VKVSNSFQNTNQEEMEYDYEPVKSSPKKDIPDSIENNN